MLGGSTVVQRLVIREGPGFDPSVDRGLSVFACFSGYCGNRFSFLYELCWNRMKTFIERVHHLCDSQLWSRLLSSCRPLCVQHSCVCVRFRPCRQQLTWLNRDQILDSFRLRHVCSGLKTVACRKPVNVNLFNRVCLTLRYSYFTVRKVQHLSLRSTK